MLWMFNGFVDSIWNPCMGRCSVVLYVFVDQGALGFYVWITAQGCSGCSAVCGHQDSVHGSLPQCQCCNRLGSSARPA